MQAKPRPHLRIKAVECGRDPLDRRQARAELVEQHVLHPAQLIERHAAQCRLDAGVGGLRCLVVNGDHASPDARRCDVAPDAAYIAHASAARVMSNRETPRVQMAALTAAGIMVSEWR
ncbi:hypothetical protein TUM20985_04980 [Mycobacterium antarcticum]|nr:hypothetical protein TUM20985_04980 [Mycolicibacterium sp. TUM20985]